MADPVTSDGRHREVKLRIASCYGKLFGVSGLRLKRKDYSTLEECLGLHPSTLGVLVQRFGALEQFAEYTPESTGMIKRLKKLCKLSIPFMPRVETSPFAEIEICRSRHEANREIRGIQSWSIMRP